MLLLFGTHVTIAQEIPSPEDYFGFQMGADRKLARWDKMVEYYHLIGEKSPRVHVLDMGPSTLGNPFLVLFISSPENLARLEELRQFNATLSDPRGVPETEIERAIDQGKAVAPPLITGVFIPFARLHMAQIDGLGIGCGVHVQIAHVKD
jgi:hypothetical protein